MKLIKRIKDRIAFIIFWLLNGFISESVKPVYYSLYYNYSLNVSYDEYKKYLITAEIICILGHALVLFLIYRTMKGKYRIILSLASILIICLFSVIIVNGFNVTSSRNLHNGDIRLIYLALIYMWTFICLLGFDD